MPVKTEESGNGGVGPILNADWTPEGVTTSTVGGITSGTNLGTSPTPIDTTLKAMFYPYVAPGISLAGSPTNSIREFDVSPTNDITTTLTPTLIPHTNPITAVVFQRSDNGGAYSTIHSQGGVATPYSNSPQTDVGGYASTSFRATASDGTQTTNSNAITYSFVYPIYYGVGADGYVATPALIRSNLTHLIATPVTMTLTVSPNNNRTYFAYPATSPDLTDIQQVGFGSVFSDFAQTLVNITGLDTTVQSYKVYEFQHNGGGGTPINYQFIF